MFDHDNHKVYFRRNEWCDWRNWMPVYYHDNVIDVRPVHIAIIVLVIWLVWR